MQFELTHLVRVIRLCQEVEQQNVDDQGKQIGENDDKNILHSDRDQIRVVEQDCGHKYKSQAGDDGVQSVAAPHFPVVLFDVVAENEAVNEQKKEVQPDAQSPDRAVSRAHGAVCDKGDKAVDKSPQAKVTAKQERGFGGMRGGERKQKHQGKDCGEGKKSEHILYICGKGKQPDRQCQ